MPRIAGALEYDAAEIECVSAAQKSVQPRKHPVPELKGK
jgi:hypothetical protein